MLYPKMRLTQQCIPIGNTSIQIRISRECAQLHPKTAHKPRAHLPLTPNNDDDDNPAAIRRLHTATIQNVSACIRGARVCTQTVGVHR